jgi:hypothetical protein
LDAAIATVPAPPLWWPRLSRRPALAIYDAL